MLYQSSRPRAGIFCLLLMEVRPTTALELPDQENTMVIKCAEENCRAKEEGDGSVSGGGGGGGAGGVGEAGSSSSGYGGTGHEFVIQVLEIVHRVTFCGWWWCSLTT